MTGGVGTVVPGPFSRVSASTMPGAVGSRLALNAAVPLRSTVKLPIATGTLSPDDPGFVHGTPGGRREVLHRKRHVTGLADGGQPVAGAAVGGEHGGQRSRLCRDVEHRCDRLLIRLRTVELIAEQQVPAARATIAMTAAIRRIQDAVEALPSARPPVRPVRQRPGERDRRSRRRVLAVGLGGRHASPRGGWTPSAAPRQRCVPPDPPPPPT